MVIKVGRCLGFIKAVSLKTAACSQLKSSCAWDCRGYNNKQKVPTCGCNVVSTFKKSFLMYIFLVTKRQNNVQLWKRMNESQKM